MAVSLSNQSMFIYGNHSPLDKKKKKKKVNDPKPKKDKGFKAGAELSSTVR